jgi:hemerythrin
MAFMEWSEDYVTGITDIDNDHQTLFMFVNDLHDKITTGAGNEDIGETLAGLVNYVGVHFTREEQFMTEAGYSDLEDHAEAHRRLSARVFALKDQFETAPRDFDSAAFLEFLKGWLTGHILYTDMDYVPILKEAGINQS